MNKHRYLVRKACISTSLIALACVLSAPAWAQSLKPSGVTPPSAGLSLRNPVLSSTQNDSPEKLQALDYIAAVVDNEPITNQEVNNLAAMADPAASKLGRSVLLNEALETLINESAQLQIARNLNIQVTATELQQAIDTTAQRNQLNLNDLQQRLQAQGITWERYKAQIKRQIMLQRVQDLQANHPGPHWDPVIEKTNS